MLKQKSDGPTRKIVEYLKEIGASVEYIRSRAGRGKAGLPDLLVGFGGVTFLMEVKTDKNDLSAEQRLFHSKWRGRKISVVRNEVDVAIELGIVI